MEKKLWIVVPCHRVIGTNGCSLDMQADCMQKWLLNTKTQQPSKVYLERTLINKKDCFVFLDPN
jgi:hypothetical protein